MFDLDDPATKVVAVHHSVDEGLTDSGVGEIGDLQLLSTWEVDGRAVHACADQLESAAGDEQQGSRQPVVDGELARWRTPVHVGDVRTGRARREHERTAPREGPGWSHNTEPAQKVGFGELGHVSASDVDASRDELAGVLQGGRIGGVQRDGRISVRPIVAPPVGDHRRDPGRVHRFARGTDALG